MTGLVDTAFVSRLGAAPLAALGVGAVVLSSVFWVFNFLGIGTQTEVARALGAGAAARAREVTGIALALAAGLGVLLALAGWASVGPAASAMGAEDAIHDGASVYLRIRILGGPAMLVMMASFGALRGLQDMRTPLWIAVGSNALNAALDAVLIFGLGPIPALGIAGAAWASTASQWVGAVWAVAAVRARIGFPSQLRASDARHLLVVGRDLFLRTGLLVVFILVATRAATRIGAESGAAHQAVRQVWLFTALVLDAYAATAQSLIGYFLGAQHLALARRVAAVSCRWGLGTGLLLALLMWLGEGPVATLLVPESARAIFASAWLVSALAQPLNALSFVTDGIHWGARDYRYLRNAMLTATGLGVTAIALIDETAPGALTLIWLATAGWISVRTALGLARVWPGLGSAPLRVGSVKSRGLRSE